MCFVFLGGILKRCIVERNKQSSVNNDTIIIKSVVLQSSPLMSERAPPEGQEDPPLHQSITSLTTPPQQHNNNNNSSSNDDSNNNTTDDTPTSAPTAAAAEKVKAEVKEQIGCFMDKQADILSGVRWEELTKMGQEMLRDEGGGVSLPPTTTTSTRRELLASYAAHVLDQEHASKSGGTKPKLRQRVASDYGSQRGSVVAGMSAAAQHKSITVLERRRLYRQMYRDDRCLPSLHIPAQVDPLAFKDEVYNTISDVDMAVVLSVVELVSTFLFSHYGAFLFYTA